jgi:hypothetical protein
MFRHQPEADRRRGRDSWTHADRAAALFRVGAPEGRLPALPFHISSRANAGRDRDESSEADSLRRPAFARQGVARDDELVLAVLLSFASGGGRIEMASSDT